MMYLTVNGELANLGANLTICNMTKSYATRSKSKSYSPICGAWENNLILSQITPTDYLKETLATTSAVQVYFHLLITTHPS